jgi:hypothetical protein
MFDRVHRRRVKNAAVADSGYASQSKRLKLEIDPAVRVIGAVRIPSNGISVLTARFTPFG